jgi:hypothetical protein
MYYELYPKELNSAPLAPVEKKRNRRKRHTIDELTI